MRGQMRRARPQRLRVGPAMGRRFIQRHPGRQRHLRQDPDLAFMQMAPQRLNRRVDQAVGRAGEVQQARPAMTGRQPRLGTATQTHQEAPGEPLLANPVEQSFEALDLGQLRQIDKKRLIQAVAHPHRSVVDHLQSARDQLSAEGRKPTARLVQDPIRAHARGRPVRARQQRLPVLGCPRRIDFPADPPTPRRHRQRRQFEAGRPQIVDQRLHQRAVGVRQIPVARQRILVIARQPRRDGHPLHRPAPLARREPSGRARQAVRGRPDH